MDFKNTLIIMTSNVGSSVIEKGGGGLGFQLDTSEEDSSYNRIKTLVNEELKQYFRPEFLNRCALHGLLCLLLYLLPVCSQGVEARFMLSGASLVCILPLLC